MEVGSLTSPGSKLLSAARGRRAVLVCSAQARIAFAHGGWELNLSGPQAVLRRVRGRARCLFVARKAHCICSWRLRLFPTSAASASLPSVADAACSRGFSRPEDRRATAFGPRKSAVTSVIAGGFSFRVSSEGLFGWPDTV